MGLLFSSEPVSSGAYLSVYSLGSSSNCGEIQKQIEILIVRREKITGLQKQCAELQTLPSGRGVDSESGDPEDVALESQQQNLLRSSEELSCEILRLRQLKIDAEARAVLAGDFDNEVAEKVRPKQGKGGN